MNFDNKDVEFTKEYLNSLFDVSNKNMYFEDIELFANDKDINIDPIVVVNIVDNMINSYKNQDNFEFKKSCLKNYERLIRLDERLNVYADQDSLEIDDFKEFNLELQETFDKLKIAGFNDIDTDDLDLANEIFIANFICLERFIKEVLL